MGQAIYLVDAFSHGPFTGNPAGVCPLPSEPSAEWMQGVAMEMNQAETAFFWPVSGGFGLRWFTPAVEVDLCGHATLASAHVLFSGVVDASPSPPTPLPQRGEGGVVRFFTKSGELVCRQVEGGIEMDFPDESPSAVDPFSVVSALGVEPVWMGANRMDWFFVLSSAEEVLALRPDMRLVAELGKRGVIVTAGAGAGVGAGVDFVSRFFAPQSGIDEDPVTGSAHCALGPYWAGRLGVSSVVGYQASKRGGYVRVDVRGDRVGLVGMARTVVVGELQA